METMNIVTVGHVDHGKSTIVGRLLADTHSLPEGKLQQVEEQCRKSSKPFEYAFLIDALKDERTQGITIDSARIFFKTKKRHYIIIDAPGHIEFLKNMVTGAARAEAALLVIDVKEGVQENSRRHGYLLSMLGIKQIAILINKIDLVSYNQDSFNKLVDEYTQFLKKLGLSAKIFIPLSGRNGDMISERKSNLPWYKGPTLLEVLDSFQKEDNNLKKPFRMPVQDVYKFTNFNDNRRIIAGTPVSGSISVGDPVTFYPSGKKSKIKTFETFNSKKLENLIPGLAAGITLEEQLYIRRGEVAFRDGETPPHITSRLRVSLFWLGKNPLTEKNEYIFKMGTSRTKMRIENINIVINASDLSRSKNRSEIYQNEVSECILKLDKALAFDVVDSIEMTSRFVIVDDRNICGGGIIREALEDKYEWIRDNVMTRNYKWIKSDISKEERAQKYSQQASLIIITGEKDEPRKEIARSLEKLYFLDGKIVYFLGIGNIIYGVDADIKDQENTHAEHLRRLAEVSNILIDAGIILIITAITLTQEDVSMIKSVLDIENVKTIWVGDKVTTDIPYHLKIGSKISVDNAALTIKNLDKENIT